LLAGSVPEALRVARSVDDEVYVVGGGQVYAEALSLADTMVISWVELEPEGDAHFPEVDWAQWREASREQCDGWVRTTYHRVQ
jgi:dihydrofolate reductase